MINYLIPSRSTNVADALINASRETNSPEWKDRHLTSTVYGIMAVAYSILNSFVYVGTGLDLSLRAVTQWKLDIALYALGENSLDALKGIGFSAVGVIIVLIGAVYPPIYRLLAVERNKEKNPPQQNLDQPAPFDPSQQHLIQPAPIGFDSGEGVGQPEALEDDDEIDEEESPENLMRELEKLREGMVNRLDSTTPLASEILVLYSEYLEDKYGHVLIIKELLYGNFTSNFENFSKLFKEKLEYAEKNNKTQIYIPFTLQNTINQIANPLAKALGFNNIFEDHLVVLCVDFKNHTIEYYNSQGGTIKNESRLVLGLYKSAKEFLFLVQKEFANDFFSPPAYHFSPTKYQTDRVSCGAHVSRFMDKRSAQTFEKACNDQVSPADMRAQMAAQLRSHYKLETPPNPLNIQALWDETSALPPSADIVSRLFRDPNHPSKLQKYTLVLKEYVKGLEGDLYNSLKRLENKESDIQKLAFFCLATLYFPVDQTNELNPSYYDPRTQYREFVKLLDLACKVQAGDSPEDKFAQKIITDLCYIRWTKVEISHYFKEITKATALSADPNYQIPPLTLENFGPVFLKVNSLIKKAPQEMKKELVALWGQQFTGEFGLKDYTGGENTPNVLADMTYVDKDNNLSSKKYLRHGSPTTAGTVVGAVGGVITRLIGRLFNGIPKIKSGEKIVPNYLAFLEEAEKRNEGIFYVVHQRMAENVAGDESERVRQIIAIQESRKNFFALVQPVEGPLFDRTGEYAHVDSFARLKQVLEEEFFDKDVTTCQLPKVIKEDPAYREAFRTLFDKVKEIFFSERLGDDNWKTFLLLFYVFQKIDMKFRLEERTGFTTTYYTTPCKDFLDRGGNMAMVELLVHMFWGNIEDPALLSALMNSLIGAAIAVKKKHVLENRIRPGLKVLEHMNYILNMGNRRNLLSQMRFGNKEWKIHKIEIAQYEEQKASPSLQEIKAPQELQAYLGSLRKNNHKTKLTPEETTLLIQSHVDRYKDKTEELKRQQDRDFRRGANQKYQWNNVVYDGTTHTVDELHAHLNDQEMLSFFHQGIMADIQKQITQEMQPGCNYFLKGLDNSFCKISNMGEKREIFASQHFAFNYSNAEDAILYRDKPYAYIVGKMWVNLDKKEASFQWYIDAVV